MKLLLNGQEIENTLKDDASLAMALQAVQEENLSEDEVISAVYVDGEPLTADLLRQWKDRPLKDFCETRIEAPVKSVLACNSLHSIADALRESAEDRQQVVDLLCKGRSTEALGKLQNYLNMWNGVQQSLAGVCRLLDLELESLEIYSSAGEPQIATDLIHHLAEQFQQIKTSLEAGDFVLMGDILEYEFSAITDSWAAMLDELADRFHPSAQA